MIEEESPEEVLAAIRKRFEGGADGFLRADLCAGKCLNPILSGSFSSLLRMDEEPVGETVDPEGEKEKVDEALGETALDPEGENERVEEADGETLELAVLPE